MLVATSKEKRPVASLRKEPPRHAVSAPVSLD
jgi:hypothetical protein